MAMSTLDELVSRLLDVSELPHSLAPHDLLDPDVVPHDAIAAKVFALRELIRTGGREPALTGTIRTSADVARFFMPRIASERSESIWVVGVDAKNRVRFTRCLASGGISKCRITPAEVVRPLILNATPGALLVHNHPSGCPTPSDEDIALTVGIHAVFELMGLRLLDHVVVAAEGYVSMRDASMGPWVTP